MVHKVVKKEELSACVTPAYGSRAMSEPVPKYTMPKTGMDPRIAYDLIRDELILDGNSRLNLATFDGRRSQTAYDRDLRQEHDR